MTELGEATSKASVGSAATDLALGTCVSVDWPYAQVNVNGQVIPLPMVGNLAPVPQQQCWVATLAGKRICLGPAATPSLGTVSDAPTTGTLPVLGDDGVTYQAAYDPNVTTWSTGQRVLMQWAGGPGGGPVVVLNLSANPSTPDPTKPDPPVVGGGTTSHDLWFDPLWSGTQNGSGSSGSGSFWTDQVYSGATTLGAWGYGSSVANTIPDGATITYTGLLVSQQGGTGGNAPTFGLHSLSSRSGTLTVSSAVTSSGGSGEKELPVSFGNALKTGSALGIATDHGGYWIYAPAGVNGSGRLHIKATW